MESQGYSVILDPYEDGKVPGLKNLREEANQVLCSHDHGDHNGVAGIALMTTEADSPFQMKEIHTYHDDKNGTLRGDNIIRILEAGTFRIAHLGDLGSDLSENQLKQLGNLDVLMVPIGGYYTIDAGQARELSAYTGLCKDVVRYHGNQIKVTAKTKPQTAVLTCPL